MTPLSQPRRSGALSLRHRELAVDGALAVAALVGSLGLLAARGHAGAGTRELDALAVPLAALASLPLVFWRRAPLAVFVVTAAASATLNALGYPPGPPLGPTVALYLLALGPERTRAPRWAVGAVVATVFGLHVGAVAVAERGFPTVPLLFGALVWGGAWVAGDRLRLRRLRTVELEQRARRAERDAERERRLAAAEERTRIARDLHDSAAHAINVILVQAGAARLLRERDPDAAEKALTTIEDVARETIADIDRLVGSLRDRRGGDGVEPPPGLAALDTLVDRHRAAGLRLGVHVEGRRRQLPPALDQAAYRILQESLTNAARHGAGAARVALDYGDDSLELTVTNPTDPARNGDAAGAGHGLLGMRERAALAGGTLDIANGDGRFAISARLPYAPTEGR